LKVGVKFFFALVVGVALGVFLLGVFGDFLGGEILLLSLPKGGPGRFLDC
jgi:hypothetical protein